MADGTRISPEIPLSLLLSFCSHSTVKFAASLLVLLAFSLTACNTPATRRDLYAPTKASGPYTKWLREGGKWPRADARAKPAPQSTTPTEEAPPTQ
jgi:hypothetical protein